jgi:HEAT repeat protein
MTEYTDRESMPILPSVEGVELEAGDRVRSLRWEGYEGTVRGVQAADPQVLPVALRVARVEKNPRVARALFDLAQGTALEDRGDDAIGALYAALGDTADDALVPSLEAALTHGGWFARASWRRSGAARALARMGTPAADLALERGLRHGAEPVRAACRDARERRAA